MGHYHPNETLRCAAFGLAVLFLCLVCVIFGCPADLSGQPDAEKPDEPSATTPPAPPPSEAPPESAPSPPPPAKVAPTDEWGGTPRDLPQDQGVARFAARSEVRSMGYSAFEVLIVVLVCAPVSVLGVFGTRVLVRWLEGRRSNQFAAEESRRNRQECRAWRHELRSWRSTHGHR
jgi:hypothetical protein